MTLDLPDDFDGAARDRLAKTLAAAELKCSEPFALIVAVFQVFADELIFATSEGTGRTAATVQGETKTFLDGLIRSVYDEYPRSVRLADLVLRPGLSAQQWSTVTWRNFRGFKSQAYEEIRRTRLWGDLQRCVVSLGEVTDTPGSDSRAEAEGTVQAQSRQATAGDTPRSLLAAYQAACPDVKNAWIYRAAGVHSPDFYRWRNGEVPRGSRLAQRLVKFLKAKQEPAVRFRKPPASK